MGLCQLCAYCAKTVCEERSCDQVLIARAVYLGIRLAAPTRCLCTHCHPRLVRETRRVERSGRAFA